MIDKPRWGKYDPRRSDMQILAARVTKEISERGLCAIYNDDLKRVWSKGGKNREQRILLFAKEHGWRLSHYTDEFIAIFTPAQP